MSDQSSQDRTGLCIFTFDDGRHCNMPHTGNELRLCYFHEKKELQRLSSRDAGMKVSHYLATNLHTACDLSAAFVMLFRAGVQGHTDPKTLNALTKLGNLVVKTHLLAKDEYLSTYDREWPYVVEQSFVFEENPATSPASSFQPAAVPQAKPSEQSKAKQSA
jgi:hypothetical protein